MNFDKIAVHLNKISAALITNRYINALKDGVIINVVPSLIGSLFLLVATFPAPGYPEFMTSVFGETWLSKVLLPVSVTLDLAGIIAVLGISYQLAKSYDLPPFPPAIVAFMSFLLLTPQKFAYNSEIITGVLPIMFLGARGLFTAILVAFLGTEIYVFLIKKKIVIKLPESVPPAVFNSFISLVPSFFTIIFFWILRMIFDATSFENIHTFIVEIIIAPISEVGTSFWGFLLYVILLHTLWFFGIHGALVVDSIYGPVFSLIGDQNRRAFQAGEALPNPFLLGTVGAYTFIGGSGGSLAVIIFMMFLVKSSIFKTVARLSFVPGIFNINEPFLFGMPVVMNPRFFIPWLGAPITTFCFTYFVTSMGWVPIHPGFSLPWTTPVIITGFIYGGWRGVLLQLANILITGSVWYYFLRQADHEEYMKELELLKTELPKINTDKE